MKNREFDFDPFNDGTVMVRFRCNACGHQVESDELSVPSPDYSAETAHDSETCEEGFAVCPECEKEFPVSIYSSYGGWGHGYIEGLSESSDIELVTTPQLPDYDEERYEAIASNTRFFDTFESEINKLADWNRHSLVDVTLRKLIYVGIVVAMETYLSDAFINTVVPSEKFRRKFVETFHNFKNRQISITQIYVEHGKLEETIKQVLLDIGWHNLPKISCMYKDTLNITFGDLSIPQKVVSARHDLVHRNGKTKDGKKLQMDDSIASAAITGIYEFIKSIDVQVKLLA